MRSSDREQLVNFKKCLFLKNKIEKTEYKGVISGRVQFGNVYFYKWLEYIGLTPNKSKTLGKIKIPNKYFIDFLRGHLDGDGSITIYKDRYNTKINPKYVYDRLFIRFISASAKHISWLQEKINTLLKLSGRIHIAKSRKGMSNLYILKFMKKESIILLKKIYYDNKIPCLSRKRKTAERYL